jgi:hypothetical protein
MRSEISYIFNPPPLINEEYHIFSMELYITGNPIPSSFVIYAFLKLFGSAGYTEIK